MLCIFILISVIIQLKCHAIVVVELFWSLKLYFQLVFGSLILNIKMLFEERIVRLLFILVLFNEKRIFHSTKVSLPMFQN